MPLLEYLLTVPYDPKPMPYAMPNAATPPWCIFVVECVDVSPLENPIKMDQAKNQMQASKRQTEEARTQGLKRNEKVMVCQALNGALQAGDKLVWLRSRDRSWPAAYSWQRDDCVLIALGWGKKLARYLFWAQKVVGRGRRQAKW